MSYVVMTNSDGELCRRELSGPVLIGRSLDCDLCVADQILSRRHCRIEPADGAWRVVDLGSRNGTSVDGERVERRFLADGSVIHAGSLEIRFYAGAMNSSDTPDGLEDALAAVQGNEGLGMAEAERGLLPGSYDPADDPLTVGRPIVVFDRPGVETRAEVRPRPVRQAMSLLIAVASLAGMAVAVVVWLGAVRP